MDPTADPTLIQIIAPWIETAFQGIVGLALALGLELARRHLGMAETQVSQDAVNKAAASMTEAMLRKYGGALQREPTVTASTPAVIEAADYVERRLPDSIKKLDMDSAGVRDLMATRINAGLANADMTPVQVPAPPPPVAVPRDIPKLDPIPPAFPSDPAMPTELPANDQTAKSQLVAELKALLEKLERIEA
jgi:hypothetical protein